MVAEFECYIGEAVKYAECNESVPPRICEICRKVSCYVHSKYYEYIKVNCGGLGYICLKCDLELTKHICLMVKCKAMARAVEESNI